MIKKSLLVSSLLLASSMGLWAQDSFFETTNYVGALTADASADWTKTGWTEFNPKNAVYPAVNETTTLAAGNGVIEITNEVVLDASKVYLLSGVVAIKSGGSLVIPAGTVIRGLSNIDATAGTTNYSMIVVEPGGKIFANGTAAKPVVFTSNKDAGSRERGDWAGILLFGKAVTNAGATQTMEGFNKVTVYQNGAGGVFGGTDNADNSGTLKYVRIEFAGLALDVNKEVNALTLGTVGSGTTVDYVQCSYSNDDSFEWFGGTVNAKHLIAYHGTDDDFDTDNGFSGKVQFGIGIKKPDYFDLTYSAASGASTSEGFESDNDASGSTNKPYTSAQFMNFTMVGPISLDSTYATTMNATTKNAFRRGARLRRNTKQTITKTIFMGYRNFLMIDGSASLANYGVSLSPQVVRTDSALFKTNLIVSTAAAASAGSNNTGLVEVANVTVSGSTDATATATNRDLLDAWTKLSANENWIKTERTDWGKGLILVDPQNWTNPDFRPVANITVGINDQTVYSSEEVYPNPVASNGVLHISATEEVYTLTNAQGVVVASGKNNKIALNNIAKGMYVLNVNNKVSKVVVE
ncbi:MAG: T9SS type A sorting domain-containing protein [Cytophagales bacterium]